MPVCATISRGIVVYYPALTGVQCLARRGLYVMTASEITGGAAMVNSTSAAELFAFALTGVVGLFIASRSIGVLLALLRSL